MQVHLEAVSRVLVLVPNLRLTQYLIYYHFRILLHVAEAVEHMHGQGCVHLDLKPGNLLIALKGAEQAGRTSAAGTAGEGLEQRLLCQVCDWELSSVNEGVCVKETRRAGGTPGYWSPEQVVELPLTNWLTSAGACNMQAVKAGAMSAYWRKPCLDPPPAAAGERVSRCSDSIPYKRLIH